MQPVAWQEARAAGATWTLFVDRVMELFSSDTAPGPCLHFYVTCKHTPLSIWRLFTTSVTVRVLFNIRTMLANIRQHPAQTANKRSLLEGGMKGATTPGQCPRRNCYILSKTVMKPLCYMRPHFRQNFWF